MNPADDALQKLTRQAESEAASQEALAAEMVARAEAARHKHQFKRILMVLLLLTSVTMLGLQWRAMREPFALAAAGESATVIEADLRAIAAFVEAYQLSLGTYPNELREVRLPESVSALVREHDVRYERTAASYTLKWTVPSRQITLDGASGQLQPDKTTKP